MAKKKSLIELYEEKSAGVISGRWEDSLPPKIRKELDEYKTKKKAEGVLPVFKALAEAIHEVHGIKACPSTLRRWWDR